MRHRKGKHPGVGGSDHWGEAMPQTPHAHARSLRVALISPSLALNEHTVSLAFIPGNLVSYWNLKPKEGRPESKTHRKI